MLEAIENLNLKPHSSNNNNNNKNEAPQEERPPKTSHSKCKDEDTTKKMSAQDLKKEGNDYFKKKLYDQSIECYSNAIASCPQENDSDLAVYHQNRAAANEQLQKWNEVVRDCSNALYHNPKYYKAQYRRGRAYEALGKYRHAYRDINNASHWEGIVLKDPALPMSKEVQEMGVRMLKLLSEQMAEKCLKVKQRKAGGRPSLPACSYTRVKLTYEYNYDVFTIPLSTNGEAEGGEDKEYGHVMTCLHERRYTDVVKCCETEHMELFGKHRPRVLLLRGTFRTLIGYYGAAMVDFREVLSTVEPNEENRLMLTDAAVKLAELKEKSPTEDIQSALNDLNDAIARDPDNATLYLHRGKLLLNAKLLRVDEANADYRKAIALDPTFFAPRMKLVNCLRYMGMVNKSQTFLEEAEKVLIEATQEFPDKSEPWWRHGLLMKDLGKPEEAPEKFDKAIALAGCCDIEPHVNKALFLMECKDSEGAEKLFREVLDRDRSCGIAYKTIANIEVERGKLVPAMENLKKAIKVTNKKSELCELFFLLEVVKSQVSVLKEAVEIDGLDEDELDCYINEK